VISQVPADTREILSRRKIVDLLEEVDRTMRESVIAAVPEHMLLPAILFTINGKRVRGQQVESPLDTSKHVQSAMGIG
jgi:hypothetical protein